MCRKELYLNFPLDELQLPQLKRSLLFVSCNPHACNLQEKMQTDLVLVPSKLLSIIWAPLLTREITERSYTLQFVYYFDAFKSGSTSLLHACI